MFLLDDLLMLPFRGLLFVAREVDKAVKAEQAAEPARITAELGELHRQLQDGRIDEAEFDRRERVLLDLLDRLQGVEEDADASNQH